MNNVKNLMIRSLTPVSLMLTASLLNACGSLSHKKDDQALANVKKVAVVAFTADEPASKTIGLDLFKHKTTADAGGSVIPQYSATVNEMFNSLQEGFAKAMKVEVLSNKVMLKNPGYAAAFHKTMDGWQSKAPPNPGLNRFLVEHVMDYDGPRILDRAGRDQLLSDLGVDAIVAADVRVYLSGTSIMGIGAKHPQANLSFAMYVKGRDEPVWFEGQIEGDESKESVGSTAFTDEEATARLSLASAKSAFAKIGVSSAQ